MKMKQIKALVLVAVLCVGTGINVKATEQLPPQVGTTDTNIEKNLYIAEGITVPTTSFIFNFKKVTKDAPEIPEQKVEYSKDDIVSENKATKIKESILNGVVFPHAGEFTYTLNEEKGDVNIEGGIMTYDTSEWTLRIYVKNTKDGKLEVSNITATKAGDGNKQEKIAFDNKFEKTTSLTVEKQTNGDFADRTKKFDFTICFTKAPTVDESITSFKNSADNKVYQYGQEYTFSLKDDEVKVFDNLLAGTTYEVIEKGAKDNYVPSVKVQENGGEVKEVKLDKFHEADSLSSKAIHNDGKLNLAGENKNYVTFTNTIDNVDVPVTGVMMNNIPYILLMVGVATGFAGYIVMKRRNMAD